VEYAKAFGHSDNRTVPQKLHDYSVPAFTINWLVSFRQASQQTVKIGDVLSGWVLLHRGIPQDSWLGHLFFSSELMTFSSKAYQIINTLMYYTHTPV